MKSHFICALLFIAALPASGADETPSVVKLFSHNNPVALTEKAQPRLSKQIAALVQSSSFVSAPDKYHVFTFAGVQQDYRDTVATGEYLLMILSPAQKINALGGEVTAAEIIVGLQSPGAKNSVFTINESGMIIAHAKYSGELYAEIKETVAHNRH